MARRLDVGNGITPKPTNRFLIAIYVSDRPKGLEASSYRQAAEVTRGIIALRVGEQQHRFFICPSISAALTQSKHPQRRDCG
jgi:hypothetical protein